MWFGMIQREFKHTMFGNIYLESDFGIMNVVWTLDSVDQNHFRYIIAKNDMTLLIWFY